MDTGIKVGDAMTRLPVYVGLDSTVSDCARLMKEKHVGSLIVKDGDSLAGIITERDLVRKAIAEGLDPKKSLAQDVMVQEVITIKPHIDIFEAIHVMKDNDIRHLPVIEDKKLIGLLTIKDILKIQPQLFETLVDKITIAEEESKFTHILKPREGICQACGNYDDELMPVQGQLMCEVCREASK